MEPMLYHFLSDQRITLINMILGAVLFIVLLILFFHKDNRDERGRKIIGKAGIAAFICFALCATFFSQYTQAVALALSPDTSTPVIDAYFSVNSLQCIYNATALAEIIGILLLKHRE